MNLPPPFKKVKLLYTESGLTSYTNESRKYHMLSYNTPPTEITKYGHFNMRRN
jgi:hypothetical protein